MKEWFVSEETAVSELIDNLAEESLGYGLNPRKRIACLEALGEITFGEMVEGDYENSRHREKSEDDFDKPPARYCTRRTAARIFRITVAEFNSMGVEPCELMKEHSQGRLIELFPLDAIRELRQSKRLRRRLRP